MLSQEILEKIAHARSISDENSDAVHIEYQNIGELLFKQARQYDRKPYLIFYDLDGNRSEFGYKDFFTLVQKCANVMAECAIRRGDRVATISHNHSDTVIQYFAAWMMGACVIPVSLSEDDHRIKYVLENSKAKLVFLRSDYSERILQIVNVVPSVLSVIGCSTDFDDLLENASPFFSSGEAVTIEDEALIVYTSGTTGNPKGVVLTQKNLLIDAKGITDWHTMTNSQRMMCVLPIHHVNGTVVTLVTPMFFGGTVVLNQKFQTEHFFDRISQERVNVVSVVPTLLAFLLQYYGTNGADGTDGQPNSALSTQHSALRHIICGAGPLTVELGAQFEDMFHIPIVHGYGLSETTCYSCFLPIDLSADEHKKWMRDFGYPSIGPALPQNEMMIADENGNPVAAGEKGEIVIRGMNVMKYYYENDEANEQTFRFGWFRSGDEGFYIEEPLTPTLSQRERGPRKYFFITGRLKELIIRGGVNISPLEIDEVLARCPKVKAAIAVGFENDFYGEEVGAYVQMIEGETLTADDVISHCRNLLPFSKAPKVVVFGNDIPVTSTGKYQRNKCKPLFMQWKAVQFRKG